MEPKLAPPGAGLPKFELYIGWLLFTIYRLLGNRDSFNKSFQREREAIRVLVGACQGDSAGRRILIERPHGLEDSSRYWSVWMTLEHLSIVHQSMIRIIRALTSGVVPEGKASTANVKPSPEAGAAAVEKFERSCDVLLETVARVVDFKTKAKYVHPWFGALNAAGWHALSANHIAIHRVQIERIVQGLRSK